MTAAREMEGYDVVVVGGGNSAGQAAIHLARFASSVTIMVRRGRPRGDHVAVPDQRDRVQPARSRSRTRCEVVDGGGDGRLEWLDVEDCDTGEVARRNAEGLFLLLGAEPHCDWLPDERRPRRARLRAHRPRRAAGPWVDGLPPENLATTVPGVFAVGDIRAGSMKRVAAASGEGASRRPARARLPGARCSVMVA